MIIATRTLSIVRDGGVTPVEIRIHDPVQNERAWACRYTVSLPDRFVDREIIGADGVQALFLAMQSIAVDLYASEYHLRGELAWQKRGAGYGFPMPKPGRDQLIGEDKVEQQ